jgi:hypothetical protein
MFVFLGQFLFTKRAGRRANVKTSKQHLVTFSGHRSTQTIPISQFVQVSQIGGSKKGSPAL